LAKEVAGREGSREAGELMVAYLCDIILFRIHVYKMELRHDSTDKKYEIKPNKWLYSKEESDNVVPEKDREQEERLALKIATTLYKRLTMERTESLVMSLKTDDFKEIREVLQSSNHNFSQEEKSTDPALIRRELRKFLDEMREERNKVQGVIEE